MTTRTWHEMMAFEDYEDRYLYLKLDGVPNQETFGHERYLNQRFYRSREWKRMRDHVIVRDNGCDMGVSGFEIAGPITIHHMNPMRPADLIHHNEDILNPDYLVAVSLNTHNAIHYGATIVPMSPMADRQPGDTTLW